MLVALSESEATSDFSSGRTGPPCFSARPRPGVPGRNLSSKLRNRDFNSFPPLKFPQSLSFSTLPQLIQSLDSSILKIILKTNLFSLSNSRRKRPALTSLDHRVAPPNLLIIILEFLPSTPPIMADVVRLAGIGYDRFTTNMRATLQEMSPEKWIRLVIIVGTYCLLRPYLLKLGGKSQAKQLEKEAAEAEEEAKEQAKMSPNELRGHKISLPGESDDDDEEPEGQTTSAEWGKKARRRQRTMVKKILEAEEKRLQDLQDDEEDKDIEEFLTQ